jgi:hypothetical protein
VAARSKTWVCGGSLAATEGSNPARGIVFCLLLVMFFSGTGLSDGPIPRPEESYPVRAYVINTQRLQKLGRKGQTKKREAKICNYKSY